VTTLLVILRSILPALRSYWPYGALVAVSVLAWHFDSLAVANANALRTQAAQFKQAQADAATIAEQTLKQQQAVYQAKATEANDAYQSQLAAADNAAAQYISTHRVRGPADPDAPGAAIAAPKSGGPDLSATVPASTVLVSSGDVQACTDAVTYGIKAHDWAGTINQP